MDITKQLAQGNTQAYEVIWQYLSKGTDQEGNPAKNEFLKTLLHELIVKARTGNTLAKVLLGNAYLNGWQVEVDIAKALRYARHAASLGEAGGEVLLGFMYAGGYGIVKNYSRAMEWFNKALKKGDSMAANNIGVMHEQGLGVKKDLPTALKFYKQSADQHNLLAIQNLERLGLAVK